MSLQTEILKRKLIFAPYKSPLETEGSDEGLFAREIDIALMSVGFKLSRELFAYLSEHLGGISIVPAVKELIGDHVQHNVYFKDFPLNVPNTIEFWFECLLKYIFTGDCEYGRYQHTYEDMLAIHDEFEGKTDKFKFIGLGRSFDEECIALYKELAGSKVPLNGHDRELLEELLRQGWWCDIIIPVRENKAIINASLLKNGRDINVDTVVDILRVAAYLSGGDVTLAANTKFKSQPRKIRRILANALENVLRRGDSALDDLVRYRERFKRLDGNMHWGDYLGTNARRFSEVIRRNGPFLSFSEKVQSSLSKREYGAVVETLKNKPGQFVRMSDKIVRECDDDIFIQDFVPTFSQIIPSVSGRVLISLYEHIMNRDKKKFARIFVNRAGKAWTQPDTLESIGKFRRDIILSMIEKEIDSRIPQLYNLVVSPDLLENAVATPLSEKTKSHGFEVLPRGSVFNVCEDKEVIRLFMYWKQNSLRTDYDLSACYYDEDFKCQGQVSWTCLQGRGCVHSGDLTDATNGASEFIDLDLNALPTSAYYIIPSVNIFAGEKFEEVEESFFGFMERDISEKGKPFEPTEVKTKFSVRGGGKVALPLVFMKSPHGWKVKWLDLYQNGRGNMNMVEQNKFSSGATARAAIERQYLPMSWLLSKYINKSVSDSSQPTTYIAISRPESATSEDTVYSLSTLSQLIPA